MCLAPNSPVLCSVMEASASCFSHEWRQALCHLRGVSAMGEAVPVVRGASVAMLV